MKPERARLAEERYVQAVSELYKLPQEDSEFCRELYWQLRSEYLNRWSRISRWTIYAVVSACLFVLLNRNLVGGATVFGVQLARLSFLTYFLPPTAAFCILSIMIAIDESASYENLMACLAKAKLSAFYDSKIHLLFTSGFGPLSSNLPKTFVTPLGRFNNSLYAGVQFTLMLVGCLSFEIYAYIYVFDHSNVLAGAIASLFVTGLFIVMTALRFVDMDTDPALTALEMCHIGTQRVFQVVPGMKRLCKLLGREVKSAPRA